MKKLKGPGPNRGPKEWQNFCTEVLMDCLHVPDRTLRIAEWTDARKQLISIANNIINKPLERRIVIADANLAKKDLSGLDLSYCYFARTNMERSNLQNCSFRYSLLRDTTILLGSDLRGADFDYAAVRDTNLTNVRVDGHSRLGMSVQENVSMSADLEHRIRRDKARLAMRTATPVVRLLHRVTGYGYGVEWILAICALVILCFGVWYWTMPSADFTVGVSSHHLTVTFWTFLFLSVERFFNASPWIFGTSTLAHLATTAETVLGLFLLGLLVAMLARQFMRW